MSNQEKDKTRVYEYAKSLNMSSKEIITILKRLDIPVNNHMSVMENETVAAVEKFFRDVKANAAAKRAAAMESSAPARQQQQSKPAPRPQQQQQQQQQQPRREPSQQQSSHQRPQSQNSGQAGGGSNQRFSRPPGQGQGGGQQRPYSQGGGGQGGAPRQQSQGGGRPQQGQAGGGGQRSSSGPRSGGFSSSQQRPGQQQGSGGAPRPQSAGSQPASDPRRQGKPPTGRPGGDSERDDRNKSRRPGGGRPNDKRFDDSRGGKFRNQRNKSRHGGQEKKEKIDNTPKKIIVRGPMTVGDLAKLLHKDASEVIKKLLFLGVMATINQELDLDTIQLIADDYKVEVELKIAVDEDNFELHEETDEEADLEERPPVVTIMGHVDHGKTTLLDAIRQTNVTLGEAGGITQHIGAYQVEINSKKITFLDTPGHEAFTSMRARGAQVTDITILVVAADDGVMPQTVEAINHAKAANVPIVVAVNKIDKEAANPDRVKQELTEHGLVPEEWGGDTIFVNVSAKNRIGLDELLEMILLVAEVRELKANSNKRARGTVLEAELDKGKGAVARVLIQNGTLRVGDAFIAGVFFGRVRTMVNDKRRRIKEAPPSTPIEITGLTEVPLAGDPFIVFEDERKARSIAERRASTVRQSSFSANVRVTLDDLYQHIKDGEMKDLNVIIKGDVQGSVEALRGSLEKIDVEGVRVKILHAAAGTITESDVNFASASNAIIIGFNSRPEPAAKAIAEQDSVDIRQYSIIYKAIEEIESAMKGLLDPVYKEAVIGHAEVRNIFKVSKLGSIAGCMVIDGKVQRNAQVRVLRGGALIFEGKIESLKRFKDDAKEVTQGFECGISLEKFNDIKEGDIIEAFVMETVER